MIAMDAAGANAIEAIATSALLIVCVICFTVWAIKTGWKPKDW